MIIKWVLHVVAEALLATVVIVLCIGLLPLSGFPSWSSPLFFVPALFYLKWRLKDRESIRPLIWYFICLCPLVYVTEFLPMNWVPTVLTVGMCLIIYVIPLDNQNRQTTSSTKPITPRISKNVRF